jgi:hypothetical protein
MPIYPNDHPAKRVLWDVLMPALNKAGYTGLEAFKMLREANDVMYSDAEAFFASPEED